jgi:hypothetical protein
MRRWVRIRIRIKEKSRIRIRIKIKSRVRIRIKEENRIRIRIYVICISNTGLSATVVMLGWLSLIFVAKILSLSFRTVFVKEALSSCLKAEREIQPIIGMTSHNTGITTSALLRNSLFFGKFR